MALPVWKDTAHFLGRTQPKVKFVQIDCQVEIALCQASKISGYPTFMMYKGVNPLQDEYHGHRTVQAFSDYASKIVATDPERHALKYHWHEGCSLKGTLQVNRVPGNFHITAKSEVHNFDEKSTNTSHIIHHFSFGPYMTPHMRKQIPKDITSHISPLDGTAFVNHGDIMSHEHYVKVVSTRFETGTLLGHSNVLGYQVSFVSHLRLTPMCFRSRSSNSPFFVFPDGCVKSAVQV